jgi:hypothetical protein
MLIGVCGLYFTGSSHAEPVPTFIRGKSVLLSWSDERTVKDMVGNTKSVKQTSELKLYVSDQGRVFSRFDRHTHGSVAGTVTQVSGAPDNYLHWQFEHGSLVADQRFIRGVRRVAISFGAGARDCSVKVLHGKEAGAQSIHYRDYNTDVELEIVTIEVTATTCSVQDGNVFAGSQ